MSIHSAAILSRPLAPLRSVRKRRAPVRVVFSSLAPLRIAPDKFALEKSDFVKSASRKSASRKSVSMKLARIILAQFRLAFDKMALSKFDLFKSAASKSARTKEADAKLAPNKSERLRIVSLRLAPGRNASVKSAFERSRLDKSASSRISCFPALPADAIQVLCKASISCNTASGLFLMATSIVIQGYHKILSDHPRDTIISRSFLICSALRFCVSKITYSPCFSTLSILFISRSSLKPPFLGGHLESKALTSQIFPSASTKSPPSGRWSLRIGPLSLPFRSSAIPTSASRVDFADILPSCAGSLARSSTFSRCDIDQIHAKKFTRKPVVIAMRQIYKE